MHRRLLAITALLLAGCQSGAPATTTASEPTSAVIPTMTALPGPTSLAEGLTTRLSTPDPSPGCPDHYPWFFVNTANECAAPVLNTWAALQTFEGGLMAWFQEGGLTYVLVDDGSLFKPYDLAVDGGASYLPGIDPQLAAPAGLFKPEGGFEKFWRGRVPGYEWVQPQLGWATAPEAGYSALWQCNTSVLDAARCYFTGPRDEIIVLTQGSALYWNYWQGPVR
ncbi:MAG TPA: hypothetical protein PK954_02055 [Anaerolineales bacterium]|nr:hypothetical protein [Anaerolineales bacterium]HRF46913.1 hypothetical protein [Anaerolineales bacterium]